MRNRKKMGCLVASAEVIEKRLMMSSGGAGFVPLVTDSTGVSSELLTLAASNGAPTGNAADSQLVYDSTGRVEVRVTATDVNALAAPLAAIGFSQTGADPAEHYVEGFIPLAAIATINNLTADGMMGVLPDYKAHTSAGEIDSEGDSILEADRTRAATGDSGAGVTVGVISDSYNNKGGAAADVATGDLPSNVNVLQDYTSGGTDEGRAMMQIVHDLAPGANLAFATADFSEAGFAQNILNLAKPVASGGAGANVIADDVYYYDEPEFQDGTVAQAVNTVEANSNVSYFSAAGNDDTQSYESTNVNFYSDTIAGISASAQQYYNFNPTGTAADQQSFTLQTNQSFTTGLQWDQPYYTTTGVTSNINMYVLNSSGVVVASATANTISSQEPFQFLSYTNSGAAANYTVVMMKSSGTTPGRIKYVNFGDGDDVVFNNYATNSDTITPHSAAVGAMSVAASPAYSQRNSEAYTSEGPTNILFNASGGRLATPQVRAKPDIDAIDGVSTTFFEGSTGYNGYPQFYGTSAATPHAAAVAALIKAANPSWTPTQIYTDLKATADPNITTTDPGFSGQVDNVNFTGAGLIDAYRAVVGNAVPTTATVNDGFESGYLGQDWTTYNAGAGKTEPMIGNSPASGSYQLIEDSVMDLYTYPVLTEAILNLNVPSYASNIVLNFSQKKFYNATYASYNLDYPMPATFTGHGNYDGVSLSVDGTHWYSILSLTGSNSTTTYQPHTFNLSTLAAADGLTLGATTQIKFQYYNVNSFAPTDGGFAFDNIAVSSALAFTGSAYYLKLDPDLIHLDVWNSNTSTGVLYASITNATVTSLTVNGTGSPQSLTVDFTNGTPYAAGLAFNGSGSALSNQLLVIGTAAGSDSVTASTGLININGTPITTTDIGTTSFAPGTGTDALTVNSGTLQLSERSGGGLVVDQFSSVSIAASSKVAVATPANHATRALIDTTALTIAGATNAWTGTLDLNGNDLAVTGGTLSTISNQLTSGFAAGLWTGTGINSSAAAADTTHLTALGGILNTVNGTVPLYGNFDGATTGTAAILVKYTYYGDADLSGKVDASDYSKIDSAFLTALTGWSNGDLNYDGKINGSDYTLIDNAFNTQRASLAAQIAPATPAAKLVLDPSTVRPTSALPETQFNSQSSWVNASDDVAAQIFSPQIDDWIKRSKFSTRPIQA